MRSIARDDVAPTIQNEAVDLRMAEVGEMTVSFISLKKGTDLGPALVGLEGDLCPCPHWGVMQSGRLGMRTPSGDQVYEAGQVFYWAPGHAPYAIEDSEYVDFSPTEAFHAVIAHITGQ